MSNLSGDEASAAAAPTWRELAVTRSLDPARTRAENRVQRYVDAAFELLRSDPTGDFTVQEVVERSGQSLRGFYQYFTGKHELLLVVFEESIRATAEHLREIVMPERKPIDRLHRFVVEYYKMCRPAPKGQSSKTRPAPAMAEFAQQLLTSYPKEASRAFVPLVLLFEELLDEAAGAGVIRTGLRHHELAGVVLQSIMFNVFATIISGGTPRATADGAEQLWQLLLQGIAP